MRPHQFRSALACALVGLMAVLAFAGPAEAASAAKKRDPDPVALLATDALSALSVLNSARAAHQVDLAGVGVEVGIDEVDFARSAYTQALARLADAVSPHAASTVPSTLAAIWVSTSDARMTVVLSALAQVGTPYRYAGAAPGAFDCSGLVQWSWSQVGVSLPRSARSQITMAAARKSFELKAGDIVYHRDHVSMYLGAGNAIVNAPQTGKRVEVRDWGRETKFGSPIT
jgi:cell wall-associated NlpC family hydrolase